MLTKIANEGVVTLARGRQDKGQYRISEQWRDFIIKIYIKIPDFFCFGNNWD